MAVNSFERSKNEFPDEGEMHASVRTTDPVEFSIFHPTSESYFTVQRGTESDVSDFAGYVIDRFGENQEVTILTDDSHSVPIKAEKLLDSEPIDAGILAPEKDEIGNISISHPTEAVASFGWSRGEESEYRIDDHTDNYIFYNIEDWEPQAIIDIHNDESLSTGELDRLLYTGAEELRNFLGDEGYTVDF